MHGRRNIVWFLVGFLAASAAGTLLRVTPAAAQSASATQISPLPSRKAEQLRRQRVPAPIPDDAADDDAPGQRTTVVRPPADETDPAGQPQDTDPQDGENPARAGDRRNGDGEPAAGTEQPLRQDGVIEVGEPTPGQRDGEPDLAADPRLRSDVDAFENPPAGYDALAFQIETVDPILDRRPARLARFEPYDALGIRRGSWVIFPEAELGLGATSNVSRSATRDSASFFDVRPTIRAVTNWRVHAIELKATGFASSFDGAASENDRSYAFEARGRYDFSKRTNMEVLVSHARDQEQRSATDALDTATTRGNVDTTRGAVAFNHRFNRLTMQLRGSITDVKYAPVETTTGGTSSNDQRNVVTRETAVRATWEFKPTLFAFTDVALNDRLYATTPSDGISRDSRGGRVVTGISFGNTGRIWRGEIGVGYGWQRPDDGRLLGTDGLILDANLAYRYSELTSLLFNTSTTFNDSTTVGQSGTVARIAGLELRHAFRRHLIASASVRHTLTDYKGISLTERDTTGELGLDYFLNRHTTLFGRYSHTEFSTTTAGGDYSVDAVRVGMRVRQ